ncbi:(d)CMP kinase [Ferrimicrobium sp.]|nr:(d)CMP kinase [Ferrimicrobium sp.]
MRKGENEAYATRSGMPVVVEPLVIAIDGPGGSGKSTVAASLATAMSLPVLSTGVFFRAVAWGLADTGVDDAQVDDWFDRHSVAVEGQLGVVDGVVLTDELRSPVVQVSLSKVAASPRVRSHVLDLERREIERLGECVVEGRDIGSVVWPHASCKFFLAARQEVRLRRRPEEGPKLFERDRKDSIRAHAPLVIADDAFIVDNSDDAVDELVIRMRELIGVRTGRC